MHRISWMQRTLTAFPLGAMHLVVTIDRNDGYRQSYHLTIQDLERGRRQFNTFARIALTAFKGGASKKITICLYPLHITGEDLATGQRTGNRLADGTGLSANPVHFR